MKTRECHCEERFFCDEAISALEVGDCFAAARLAMTQDGMLIADESVPLDQVSR
jgi:hypothetical protein